MGDNKTKGKLDYRNLKGSQFNGSQIERMEFSELNSAKRVTQTNAILKDPYTHFTQVLDESDRPTKVTYFQALDSTIDKITFRADVGGDLAGTYYSFENPVDQKVYVLYQVVNGTGDAPEVGDIELPVNINTNDSIILVAYANRAVLNTIDDIKVLNNGVLDSFAEVEYLQFGLAEAIDLGTTGFSSVRNKPGDSRVVSEVDISYDENGNVIYQDQLLKGAIYDVYSAAFNFPVKSSLTDENGDAYSPSNPLHVQLSDGSVNIGTVNGELEVQLSRQDNNPDSGDVHDSVRIGNQTVELDYTNEGFGLGEAKVHDQDVQDKLDTLTSNLNSQFDESQVKLDSAISELQDIEADIESLQSDYNTQTDETQTILQTEFDATQTLLQTEFDQTQVKLDSAISELQDIEADIEAFKLDYNTQTDETQTILQTEFDATQTILQTEFDQTQTKLDAINTNITTESNETQTILQTEFDATQALLQAEFDETQLKQDSQTTELQAINAELDSINVNITTEGNQTQVKLDTISSDITALQNSNVTESNETQVKLDSAISELQDIEADIEAFKLDYNTQTDATQLILQTEFDETQTKLDTINSNITSESNETQTILQTEFDQTQTLLQTEFDATQTLLQAEFDETQTKLDTINTNIIAEGNETQTILQTEFDQSQVKLDTINTNIIAEGNETQTILQTEFDATQALLQTEFDATQVKLDTINTSIVTEGGETQTILQTEFDATQALLQSEFDATQVKLDTINTSIITEGGETQTILQTEFDATQTLLQTEFDQSQVKLDTIASNISSLESSNTTESNETQVKLDSVISELQDIEADIEAFKLDYNTQTDATQLILQTEFDETQTKLDTINTNITTEGNQTQTILQTEFDQSQVKLDTAILELQDIEADIEALRTDYNTQTDATQLILQTEFDATQVKLDTINTNITTEGDQTQTILQTEFDATQVKLDSAITELQDIEADIEALKLDYNTQTDETQTILQTEFDATQTLLQTEFDATQVKLDTINTSIITEGNETQTILQTEFDATQALLQSEFDATQVLLQAEFDETQTKLDTINTNITTESNETQTILQTEFDQTQVKLDSAILELQDIEADVEAFRTDYNTQTDATQLILQTEFDQSQVKLDSAISELQDIEADIEAFKLDYNTQTDETQTILQTEFDATQVKLDSIDANITTEGNETQTILQTEFDATQTLLQTEFDQSQVKLDSAISELQDIEADIVSLQSDYNTQTDETQTILQTEFDATQTLLQTEFDQSQVKLDSVITELQDIEADIESLQSDYNTQTDETQTILQTEFDATQALLQSEFDETQTNQNAQTSELQDINTELDTIKDILNQGKKDPLNSSQAQLLSGENWVGDFQESRNLNSILSIVISDTKLDAASIEWSSDGSTLDTGFLASDDILVTEEFADGFYAYVFLINTIRNDYYRLNITNSVGAPTTMYELATFRYDKPYTGQFSIITKEIGNFDLALLTRSLTTAQQPDGDYVNAKADGQAVDVDGVIVHTETPLLASTEYTSGWVDSDGYKSIEISIQTDQESQENGVIIEYTADSNVTTPVVNLTKRFTFSEVSVAEGDLTILVPPRLDGFRIRYINGSVDQGHFLLSATERTATMQPVSVPINNPINDNTNANIVRSIVSGQLLDELLNKTSDYGNVELTRNNSLKTQSTHEVLFKYATPTDPALPSGSIVTIDPVYNAESNVVDSGWIPVREFKVQDFNVISDEPVKVFLLNASDDQGNNIQGNSNPTLTSKAAQPANVAARFFDDYFRLVICNDSGSTSNNITIRSTGGNGAVQPVDISIEQPVLGFFPAPIVQSVIKGEAPDGLYEAFPMGGLDSQNTTKDNLAASGTFVGEYQKLKGMSSGLFFSISDAPLDSIKIQYSPDGSTISTGILSESDFVTSEVFIEGFYIYITVVTTFVDNYYRLEVTNGATPTTIFEAHSFLYDKPYTGSYGGLEDVLSNLSVASLTRAVQAGVNPDGDFINSKQTGVSSANSTTDLLNAFELFEGDVISCKGYTRAKVTVNADVDSDLNGLAFLFYEDEDGTNLSRRVPFTYNNTNSGDYYSVPVQGSYVKVEYTNGPDAQTNFNLTTSLSAETDQSFIGPIKQPMSDNLLASFSKSVLEAKGDDNIYKGIGRGGSGEALNVHLASSSSTAQENPVNNITFAGQVNISASNAVNIERPTNMSIPRKLTINVQDAYRAVYMRHDNTVTENNGHIITNTLPYSSRLGDISSSSKLYEDVWLIAESGEGSESETTLSPDTVDSNTGVVNPSNSFVSDNQYTSLDSLSDTYTVSGFDGSSLPAGESIDSIAISAEVRKQPGVGTSTVTFVDTVGIDQSNSTSLTSPTVISNSSHTYIVSISRRDEFADVTNITNTMGFSGFEEIEDTGTLASESRTSVYRMLGTPTQDGTITATFSTGHDYAVLSVTRLENVHLTNPVASVDTFGVNSTTSYSGTLPSATANGIYFNAIGLERSTHSTASTPSGSVERFEDGSSTNNNQVQAIITGPISTTGALPFSGSTVSNCQLTYVAIAFNPAAAKSPKLKISHSEGSTELNLTASSESDSLFSVDITNDASFDSSVIDGMTLTVEVTDIGDADAEIDHLYLDIRTSSNSVKATYIWEGES